MTARDGQGKLLFRNRLMELLEANLERYSQDLEAHFMRHLAPFASRKERK